MPPVFNVAVLIYPGADILDFSGPIEVYATQPPSGVQAPFSITTFAHHNPVKAAGSALMYTPHATFAEVEGNLDNYDILVLPGADPNDVKELLQTAKGEEIISLVSKFAGLEPRERTGHRICQSVCTGTMLLAAAGILSNRTVTTHHIAFDILKQVADQAAGGASNVKVVQKRWVDAGKTEAGVRIVNAGGVTSGIDASLWISEELVGQERTDWVADILEFERRREQDGWGAQNNES